VFVGLPHPGFSVTKMKQFPPSGPPVQPTDGPTLVAIPQWSTEPPTTSLSVEDRANLAQISTIVHFRRGDVIHGEERVNAIFIIIAGVAKSWKILENGHTHITGFFFSDEFIGMAERGKFIESATAITEVSAYRVPVIALERVILNNPFLSFQMMAKILHRMRDLQRRVYLLSKKSARAKIGYFLKIMTIQQSVHDDCAQRLYLPMARIDIATYIGISPEAVSRGLRELAITGAIAFPDRHHVEITDPALLDQIAADLRSSRR